MKKLSKIVLTQAKVLERREMKQVFGGSSSDGYRYFLRCDQERPNGYVVSNCDRATMEMYCDSIPPIPICVITY